LSGLIPILGNSKVVKYIGDGRPTPPKQTELALDSMIQHYKRHGYGRLALFAKTSSRLIGYAGLRCLSGEPELVYLLDEPFWGKGLATEAAAECLRYSFEDLRSERVVAMTKPENLVSMKVLGKLGFHAHGFEMHYGCKVAFFSLNREHYHRLKESRKSNEPLINALSSPIC
jgi:RimJ/RimL family protein N-acetyltransferase